MQLGQTEQYKSAIEALSILKGQLGATEELKAIALFLFYVNGADAPTRLFPFVGLDDERDRSVVRAYEEAWKRVTADEDDDFE